jgi:electron transport complex protein RnfD
MAVVGSLCAIVIAKQLYGGIGYNLFNPALVGRCVLLVSFPVVMTTWATPHYCPGPVDALTMATPLGAWKTALSAGHAPAGFFELFTPASLLLGNRPGSLGETSVIALVVGGIILLWRRCITWHTPVAYIGTVAVMAACFYKADPVHNLPPLYHVLSGGLFLGALFMATDMVTTPVTRCGMFVFGAGCGLLTMLIRKWGGYPEGVSFAILIMNSLTPLINRFTRPRVFGHLRKETP